MQANLDRLIDVYRQERDLYRQILERVHSQRRLIESGASYGDINTELGRKRDLLQDVEALEAGIREDRELWRRRRQELDGDAARRLMTLLAEVTVLVEEIRERERENEVLLTGRRRRGARPIKGAREAAASYQRHNRMELKA
jgi:hypothetical protein